MISTFSISFSIVFLVHYNLMKLQSQIQYICTTNVGSISELQCKLKSACSLTNKFEHQIGTYVHAILPQEPCYRHYCILTYLEDLIQSSLGQHGFSQHEFAQHEFVTLHRNIFIARFYTYRIQCYANIFWNSFSHSIDLHTTNFT